MQVFHGMLSAAPDRFDLRSPSPGGGVPDPPSYLLALWQHECQRVFCDKLVCEADRAWVQQEMATLAGYVGTRLIFSMYHDVIELEVLRTSKPAQDAPPCTAG